MQEKRVGRWISTAFLAALLATFVVIGCAQPLGETAGEGDPKQAAEPVSQAISRELTSNLKQATPTAPFDTPPSATAPVTPTRSVDTIEPTEISGPINDTGAFEITLPEAESLETKLTRLYRAANPAVVYILVDSGLGSLSLSRGSGSGFVYDVDGDRGGHIVTNNHVVDEGTAYEIVFAGGERRRAEFIGSDPDSDLAVLRIDALPDGSAPLPLADEPVEVGQFAIAIGNPFGAQGSMSLGIISGLDRSLPSQRETTPGSSTYSLPQVVQTDAPINPGNSGGPLLNLNGEVVGVNVAIATLTGENSGVGFSIPVSVVKRVVPSLIRNGEIVYPYMGVNFDGEVSLDEQELYGIDQIQGAYVTGVTPGGPGDQAGLIAANAQTGRGGDLIIQIDDQPIRSFSDLNAFLVLEAEVGQTIDVTVLRGEATVKLSLTLGARP